MGANLTDAILVKLTKLAEAAPKSKITIIYEGEVQAQIDALVSFAQELGLEVSVEKREGVEKVFSSSVEVITDEKLIEWIEPKPIVMESSKQFLDKEKSMHREHMKQM